ncbi:MAG: ABC transporter substrate-binding protein [Spirochaetaceae bacterium]
MSKKLIIVISLILIVVLSGILWLRRPIKIGVLFSLETSTGNEENLAVQFYNHKYPKIGLRPVKLIIENPTLEETSIKEAYHKLYEEGVSIIIGAAISATGVVIANDDSIRDVPFFSPSTSSVQLSNKKDNFYRLIASNYIQGQYPAEYLNTTNLKRIVMLLSEQNRAYSEPLADAFIKNFNGEGIKVFNDVDHPDPQKIINLRPDGIFFILSTCEMMQYLQPIYDDLPDIVRMTSTWGHQQLESVFSGDILNNLIVITPSGDKQEDYFEKLTIEFEENYRIKSSFVSTLTLSSMEYIYNVIEQVGDNRDNLLKYLSENRVIDWSFGKVRIDSFGDAHNQYYYLYEIMNNELNLKEKFIIPTFEDN